MTESRVEIWDLTIFFRVNQFLARTFGARYYLAEVELFRYAFVMKLRQSYQVLNKNNNKKLVKWLNLELVFVIWRKKAQVNQLVELVRYAFVMKLCQSYQVIMILKTREMTESRAEIWDLTKNITSFF